MAVYRLHDEFGDLGLVEHPAPNLEPGDVLILREDWEVEVLARVDAEPDSGVFAATLEVVRLPRPAAAASRRALRPPYW